MKEGAAYLEPDHSRLINPRATRYKDPADHPFFRANPVSARNIAASYDRATPQQKAQGMRWYADAHDVAAAITGGDVHLGANLLAAYSPQTPWPANMFNAARAAKEHRALGKKDGMISGDMQKAAQRALDGDPQANKSPKTSAFAKLIEYGGDTPDDTLGGVVIDRHAMSVAMGRRLGSKESMPIGNELYYQNVADEYRKAALAITARGEPVAPHQLQAITWLTQQTENDAADAAEIASGQGNPGMVKGRMTSIRNQWAAWAKQAAATAVPVVTGTTALSNIGAQLAEMLADDEGVYDPEVVELTGDGHGHHIPGTPMVYRHGWQRIGDQASPPWTRAGDVVTYSRSLGVDRADMPQLSGLVRGAYVPSKVMLPKFTAAMQAAGVKVTRERVSAASLRPTQTTGDARAIEGIAAGIRGGKEPKPAVISSDNRVVDGHHTWAGGLVAGSTVPVIRVGLPADELMARVRAFSEAEGIASRKTGEAANPAHIRPPLPADSLAAHTLPDGSIEPVRAALHKRIVEQIVAGHPAQAHPVAMFFGGGSASGKSALHGPDGAAKIDADEIKRQLPEFQRMTDQGDRRAAAHVHEESSMVAKQAVAEAEKRRIHFILDGTGDSDVAKLARKVQQARDHGYAVHSRYVTVDTEEAVRRAAARAEKTGRAVPEATIRQIHAAVSNTYAAAVQQGLFDSTELYDNNGTGAARRIAHGEGAQFTVEDPAAWQRFLSKGQGEGAQ